MNAVPMIVACCLGQGCHMPPWREELDEYPPPTRRGIVSFGGDADPHFRYHESTLLDDQERHQ